MYRQVWFIAVVPKYLNFVTSIETKMALCFDSVVFVTQHRNAASHDFCVLLSPVLLHPAGVYDTWTTQIAPPFPLPLPRTFRPSPCTWSKVEQLPPPESVTCPPLSVPHQSTGTRAYAQSSWDGQWRQTKQFGIFLCLTALGIDTNLVTSYNFYTLSIYYVWGTSGFGGLEVACWPLVPKFAGSNPIEAVGFLSVNKKILSTSGDMDICLLWLLCVVR